MFSLFLLSLIGKKTIYIPDQGGWVAFRKYPQYLKFNVKKIKTHLGKPNLEDIKKIKNSAFLLCSSPGYLVRFKEKEIKEIKKILNENSSFLIMDCSSGFIFKGDVMIMSFGFYKPINLGIGGLFEVTNNELKEIFIEHFSFFNSLIKIKEDIKKECEKRLKEIDKRLNIILNFNEELKQLFKEYLLKELEKEKSLNIALVNNEKVKRILKENSIPFVKMPNYNRLHINGFSLESKKMLFNENTKDLNIKQLKEKSKEILEQLLTILV